MGLAQQVVVGEPRDEVADRPADIRGDQVEHARGGRREQLDPKAGVQEYGGDVGRVEEIGHVVTGRLHLLDFVMELAVDGAQLLVEGLQLLLGGLQLLVGGLELLVHRHDFFVRRFEFLVGTLHLLDGALQVIARGLQLLLELAQQLRLCCLGVAFVLRPAASPEGFGCSWNEISSRPAVCLDALRGSTSMFTRRMSPSWRIITPLMLWAAFSRMARRMTTRSLGSRALRQRKQVLRGWAAWLDEVVLGRPGEVQDLVIAVDHNASQTKPVQQGVSAPAPPTWAELGPAGRLRRGAAWLRLHRRELQVVRPSRADAPVNAPFLGDRLEQVGLPANRLRRAQEQVASLFESEVQEGDDLLLHLRFEVDQEVAATDQVHLGKGGVGDQVLNRKRHCFAHLFADLPGGFVHPREKAGQPFRRDIGGDALGIDSPAGDRERVFIDIRGEDLQAAEVLLPPSDVRATAWRRSKAPRRWHNREPRRARGRRHPSPG